MLGNSLDQSTPKSQNEETYATYGKYARGGILVLRLMIRFTYNFKMEAKGRLRKASDSLEYLKFALQNCRKIRLKNEFLARCEASKIKRWEEETRIRFVLYRFVMMLLSHFGLD